MAEKITHSGGHLQRLTQDILTLTRIHRSAPRPTWSRVEDLVQREVEEPEPTVLAMGLGGEITVVSSRETGTCFPMRSPMLQEDDP